MVERMSLEKLTGAVLGNYRLEKLLEQDKYGPVFLASTKAGTNYVVRFVGEPLQDAQSKQAADARIVFLGRFQQEANLVATLQHPHILPLLDYGNYRSTPYLVYPNVSLNSLRSLLTQKVPPDLASVDRHLSQIASALEYAHQRAVIHRNLSTSCIFMQANHQLVVAEFGQMRMRELSKQDGQSGGGYTFDGSSESSAPEQLLGKPVDVYTDIYALGAVLYRLLTGHAPFTGKTRDEVTQKHLYAEVPSLNARRQGLPVELDSIITKAMAKEPMQRYRQPTAFAQAYHQVVAPHEPYSPLIASQPVAVVQAQPLPSVSTTAKRPVVKGKQQKMSRRKMVTVLAAGGGIVVVGGIALAGVKFINNGATTGTAATSTGNTATTGNAATSTQPAAPATTKGPAGGGNVLANSADIPVNSAKTFPIANQKHPGVLIHLPSNNFVAFDSTCTHAGCAVAYDQQDSLLKCPCHDAFFDPAKGAAVVQGPAPTPLASIKITVNADGTITA